jgi:isopenicillin N synthase-like dioxygenase
MSTAQTLTYTTLELATPNGPVHRRVATTPPRKPTSEEIPVIDLSSLDGDLASRKAIAARVKAAAEITGFFYVKNHGIPDDKICGALDKVKAFFDQPSEEKEKILFSRCGKAGGYHGVGATQLNKTETAGMLQKDERFHKMPRTAKARSSHERRPSPLTDHADRKETFSMRYDSRNDPTNTEPAAHDNPVLADSDTMWSRTTNIPDFKSTLIEFWQLRLSLARKMIRIFALALDLPENTFDTTTTHPGADAVFIHYPGTQKDKQETPDVGIGAHTDIQVCILPTFRCSSSNR